jgi:hypothetical protein
MNATDFAQFQQECLAAGFDQPLERRWEPHTMVDTHSHPFAVLARVSKGEMWLTVEGQTAHLLPGSSFALERNAPHQERYGPEGASYWVGRKT